MSQTYAERKEAARERARCIELYLEIQDVSWGELAEIQAELQKLAVQNGLVREFKENGLL